MRLHSCRTTTFTRVTSFPAEKNKPRCGGNLSPGLALKTEAGLPLTNCFLSWCNSKRASCFCCVMVCINVAVYVCLCVCVRAYVRVLNPSITPPFKAFKLLWIKVSPRG